MNPYILMTVLYLAMAVLAALDSTFASLNWLPWFNGLRWLRAHFITIGVMTEAIFGLLPGWVALWARQPKPKIRWDIFIALNLGLLALLVGIPLINAGIIIAGGTLVFLAAALLLKQLIDLHPERAHHATSLGGAAARKFYIAGLGYLLLGILVGTGLWLGWGDWLKMAVPREVHVHSNLWGFTSLVFAGLFVDLYPQFAKRPLAWQRSLNVIFWMMTIGELGLVVGPWIGSNLLTVPGLVLHFSSTALLLANVIKPLWGDRQAWTASMWHLVAAYTWMVAPAILASFIIAGTPGFPADAVETIAPPMMIYGWLLQFSLAIVPFLVRQALHPNQPSQLGGNWFSLISVNLGAAFILSSAFLQNYAGPLNALAFGFWALAILPVAWDLWRVVSVAVNERVEKPAALLHPIDQ